MATIVNLLKDFSQMGNVKLKMSYGRHIAKHVKKLAVAYFMSLLQYFQGVN
jgi:hypothetical protein